MSFTENTLSLEDFSRLKLSSEQERSTSISGFKSTSITILMLAARTFNVLRKYYFKVFRKILSLDFNLNSFSTSSLMIELLFFSRKAQLRSQPSLALRVIWSSLTLIGDFIFMKSFSQGVSMITSPIEPETSFKGRCTTSERASTSLGLIWELAIFSPPSVSSLLDKYRNQRPLKITKTLETAT